MADGRQTYYQEAAATADVVVLCTPWQGTRQAVQSCGDLAGKVVIDCTNPLTPHVAGLEVGHTTTAAEQVAGWTPWIHLALRRGLGTNFGFGLLRSTAH